MDDETSRLSWNPSAEQLIAWGVASRYQVNWSGDVGTAGQVLTSQGGSSVWTWEDVGDLSGGIPQGVIVLWSGSSASIPTGWTLCDGNNSTPNLVSKFVVGAKSATGDTTYPGVSVGAQGGYSSVYIPEHTHTYSGSISSSGGHNHTYTKWSNTASKGGDATNRSAPISSTSANTGGTGNHTHSYSGTTANNTGGAAITNAQRTNRNLPPYYALCYIMKT